jgi:hypothetical protein
MYFSHDLAKFLNIQLVNYGNSNHNFTKKLQKLDPKLDKRLMAFSFPNL